MPGFLRIVDWDVVRRVVRRLVVAVGLFLLSAWLAMVLWGMVAARLSVATISYSASLLILLGLWVVIVPMIWVGHYVARRGQNPVLDYLLR